MVELYSPGAVDPTRWQVTFRSPDGVRALVTSGELTYATEPRSCTCVEFALDNQVCFHMKARDRAFRRFAREYGLPQPDVRRPLWAEDVGDR